MWLYMENENEINSLVNNIFKEFNITVIRHKYTDDYNKVYR